MRKFIFIISVLLIFALVFASCAKQSETEKEAGDVTEALGKTPPSESADVNEDDFDPSLEAASDFTITPSDGVEKNGSTYVVTSAGTYTLSGRLDGNVAVKAGEDDDVTLILSGCTISSQEEAPISILSAGDAAIEAAAGTYNAIYDSRTGDPEAAADEDDNVDGAIYSVCDLSIFGTGHLAVESAYDNGVKTKDDLKIEDVTLKVTSPDNALKGNDSVTVSSGSLILKSTESDGVKTSNSGTSGKGKQKGSVTICGGHVDIYAARDGISAAYDVEISDKENCVVNVRTASYADVETDDASGEMYLILSTNDYDTSHGYFAYFYNGSEGVWKQFEYDSMVYSGRTAYYGLKASAPSGYESFLINITESGETPDGENCIAASEGDAINDSMNAYFVTDISDGEIEGDWVTLSSGGSSGKTTFSSKGIKAANEISISGGDVTIYSMDDAIHANAGDKLENGSSGKGNITITDGEITINCADDGIHADGSLTISGGHINVAKSHEGLEANVVNVAGGDVFIYADDDGINACAGNSTPLVNVTGGYVDVTTPSGDTDAVDSNGSFTMSGGFALIKGGAGMGQMAGSVDVDGTVSVTGGTLIAFGGICEVPDGDGAAVYVSNGTSFSAGDYTLTDGGGKALASFTLNSSYNSVWIASGALTVGSSYTLTADGASVLNWTQSSAYTGDTVQAGFGGGPGGFGGPGRR